MTGVQTIWGWPIAAYLFLAGVAAGAYLSAFYAWSRRGGDNLVSRSGILLAAPCLGVSILFLFYDIGKPLQFMNAFLRPHSSMISVGTWVLTIFFIISAVQWVKCVQARRAGLRERDSVWFAGFIFAVLTAFYTGVLLWEKGGVPFWNTPLLPVLFLVSALSTGIGAILIGVLVFARPKAETGGDPETLHSLCKAVLWLVGFEALLLLLYLLVMGQSQHLAAAASVRMLLGGSLAPAFWLLVVVVGLAVPFYLEWNLHRKQPGRLSSVVVSGTVAGACLLIGGLALRYLILAVGVFKTFGSLL